MEILKSVGIAIDRDLTIGAYKMLLRKPMDLSMG